MKRIAIYYFFLLNFRVRLESVWIVLNGWVHKEYEVSVDYYHRRNFEVLAITQKLKYSHNQCVTKILSESWSWFMNMQCSEQKNIKEKINCANNAALLLFYDFLYSHMLSVLIFHKHKSFFGICVFEKLCVHFTSRKSLL